MDSDTKYFRAGVGTVIYNNDYQVAVFKRLAPPTGIWQFQQGGIDTGETIEDTLWRELKEEVGLERAVIETIIPYPHWTIAEYPPEITEKLGNKTPNRLGQVHRWFFLELQDGVEINLTNATDQEFSDFQWVSFEDIFTLTSDYRRPTYQELYEFFVSNVKKERS